MPSLRCRWVLAALMLLTVVFVTPVASAEETHPLGAAPISATLRGNPYAGAYHLYEIQYPGGNVDLLIRVRSLTGDVVAERAFGLVLYRPYAGPLEAGVTAGGAYREVGYSSPDAGVLTVQLYNFSRMAITYELAVVGLEPAADSTTALLTEPAAPEAPAPAEVIADEGGVTTLQGALVGDRAGSFAEYRLEAVAGEQLTITMENLPIDPAFGQSIGFRMYGPDGKLAAKGVEMRPFYWWDTLMAPLTGEYTLQVHNYAPGVTLTYTINIER